MGTADHIYSRTCLCKARNVTTQILKSIGYLTGSQSRAGRVGIMGDRLLDPFKSLAAAFGTIGSQFRADLLRTGKTRVTII